MSSKSKTKGSDAYRLFCESVYTFVRTIPPGRVMTYGGIAIHLSRPEGIDPLSFARIRARWVGYALKACPEDVPWWRVVNAEGKISQRPGHGPHVQRIYLEQEGIVFEDPQHLSLSYYMWEPGAPDE
jgi:methylated-DNA-protein-cysteine methyltransferase-like protein